MSVQNIIDPATGQIDNSLINVAGLGVVTNPLTATLQGQTAYGLTDANVVSTGVLQTDNIQAYSVLPGAPIAVTSPVKLQAPADRIDMEKVGVNTIAVPDGSLVLTATDPATTTATAYLDQGSLRVENGINAPSIFANAGSGYNAALSASAGGQITSIQANAPAQQLAIVADVANTKNIINAVGQPLDIQTNAGDITMKPSTGRTMLTETTGADVVVRLENQGGKGGEIIASKTGGYMAVQAKAGYNLLMESTNQDTTLTASVNNGTAKITLTDTAGVGDVVLSAGGTYNSLKQTATATEINGDNSNGAPAIIQFMDPNLGPAQLAYIPDTVVFTNNEIQATSAFLGVSSGIVEGVSIGSDFATNYVVGKGLPLVIAQDMTNRPTNYISLFNGDTAVVASNTVSLGLGASPSVLVDANNSKLLIDSATGSAGLQYDGASATPVQFHFNSADFLSGTSGGSTGQHLRIFVNGTEYKIKLENA